MSASAITWRSSCLLLPSLEEVHVCFYHHFKKFMSASTITLRSSCLLLPSLEELHDVCFYHHLRKFMMSASAITWRSSWCLLLPSLEEVHDVCFCHHLKKFMSASPLTWRSSWCLLLPGLSVVLLWEFLKKALPGDLSLFKRSSFQVLFHISLLPPAHFHFRVCHPIML